MCNSALGRILGFFRHPKTDHDQTTTIAGEENRVFPFASAEKEIHLMNFTVSCPRCGTMLNLEIDGETDFYAVMALVRALEHKRKEHENALGET